MAWSVGVGSAIKLVTCEVHEVLVYMYMQLIQQSRGYCMVSVFPGKET